MTLRIVAADTPIDSKVTTQALLRELVARRVDPDNARREMKRLIRLRDKGLCTMCRGVGCPDCCYSGDRHMQLVGMKAERDAIKSGHLLACPCGMLSTKDHAACRGCDAPLRRNG